MKQKYVKPDAEVIKLSLSVDVLGQSTFTPEDPIVIETTPFEDLE